MLGYIKFIVKLHMTTFKMKGWHKTLMLKQSISKTSNLSSKTCGAAAPALKLLGRISQVQKKFPITAFEIDHLSHKLKININSLSWLCIGTHIIIYMYCTYQTRVTCQKSK